MCVVLCCVRVCRSKGILEWSQRMKAEHDARARLAASLAADSDEEEEEDGAASAAAGGSGSRPHTRERPVSQSAGTSPFFSLCPSLFSSLFCFLTQIARQTSKEPTPLLQVCAVFADSSVLLQSIPQLNTL